MNKRHVSIKKSNKISNLNDKNYSVLLVISSTIFTSLAQLLFKFGSRNLALSINLIYNWQLILGLALYGIGAIILIYALKSSDLNYLYPFLSLSLIWVSLISLFLFNESINWMHALGISTIILGVIFVGKGNSTEEKGNPNVSRGKSNA